MNRRIILAIICILAVVTITIFLLLKNTKKTETDNNINVDFNSSVAEIFKQAQVLEDKGEMMQSQAMYKNLINTSPSFHKIQEVEDRLGEVNIRIIASGLITPQTIIYEVQPEDSLSKIAKKFNTTIELIKKSNALSSDIIKIGQRLRIWVGKFSCVVDKSQNILILKSNDEVIKNYKVSTGLNNSTPVGSFRIVNKLTDPVWYKTGAVVEAGSPENILGTRWMGFDLEGYGVHGTTDPASIGQQVTQGCIRLTNLDVEELYMFIPLGTEVTVVD